MMANGNPLANIGRANDPTLAPRTVAASTAASALPGILGKQSLANLQSGINSRNTALGAMQRKLIELGLPPEYASNPNDPRFRGALTTREEEMALDRQLKGIRLGGDVGIWSKLQPGTPLKTIGATASRLPTTFGATLGQLKAAAGTVKQTGSREEQQVEGATPDAAFPLKKVITKSAQETKMPGGLMGPFQTQLPRGGQPQAQQAPRKLPPILKNHIGPNGVAGDWKLVPGTETYVPIK
jgi:hypothetical protein